MTKHTPGPWVWRGKSGSLHQAGTDGYQFGATVLTPTYEYDEGTDTKVSEADAKLIAAAPDLLVAAQALEKAEEAHANCEECGGEEVPELCPVCFPLFDDARILRRLAIDKASSVPRPNAGGEA